MTPYFTALDVVARGDYELASARCSVCGFPISTVLYRFTRTPQKDRTRGACWPEARLADYLRDHVVATHYPWRRDCL